ncbi:bifunctional folylpolyglutamate synthase/dihydrofolate synthase [Oceanisphaera psychrotolerans]|uniref:Dihydrofolate synthase/folylpolyglutamate synthase n=2 Tax=Oceanisphaera psychrotolerans TaxID=1414654 RepID=A0A1J4QJN0_9GAMM|nr:bifunctional tetrahydrofolate synthase/dihydrofolate synthase [Oceanisphaera psychrotolerans]OIN13159.1 bifunctional folylpolyglutamate synthase/dihydrofolate synthase [Oceanisphaera psychrotolerans]
MSTPVDSRRRSLADWLVVLESLNMAHIELGLERMTLVAGRLGLLSLPSHVITVGGTNGKGTTCALLEAMLRAGGHSVGVYSSPHLVDYRERVRIDGSSPSAASFCAAFAAVETARAEVALTYFEFTTLAALWLFRDAAPEVVLLEVGLGGRLDATNVVASDQTVVTTVALDHTDWLGSDRETIGFEKAGIFRAGKPAVCGDPEPPASLLAHAEQLGTPLSCTGRDYQWQQQGDDWCFHGLGLSLDALPLPSLPLMNAATALATLALSPFALDIEAIKSGLQQARLSGRLQQLTPGLWVDVAHNPESAGYLASRLAAIKGSGRCLAVVGMLKDKDIAASLAPLRGLVDDWYLASLGGPRGASADELAERQPGTCFGSVTAALAAAEAAAGEQDVIIAFGSFFTVADVLANRAQ